MRNSKSKFKGFRVVLALSIALVNILVSTAAPKDAGDACYKCILLPGGATGYYADCSSSGSQMSLCLYTTITQCFGYRCGGFGEEEAFDPEGGGGA